MTGIDISDTAANSSCYKILDGKRFFTFQAQNDSNRDFDRGWRGISGNIGLFAHELRHVDGFAHVSCCGIPNGCDQTYDETNLSSYGIQWWLEAHWLTGALYVGFSCLEPTHINEIASWHAGTANVAFRDRFRDNKPPVLTRPAVPGGPCRSPARALDLFMLVDLSGSFADDLPAFKAEAPAIISRLTAKNPDVHVGLGSFEDYPIAPFGAPVLGDQAYTRLVDLTADRDLVLTTIAGLTAPPGAGGDDPQSQLPALFQAATGAGQDLAGLGFPGASIPPGQQAHFHDGATKLILLWTDASFHRPGDPGAIPYPGPSFNQTVEAVMALDPPKVIGISSGGDGLADLQEMAAATGALAPPGGVDCDDDGIIDLFEGEPLVCPVAPEGQGIGEAIPAIVEAALEPGAMNDELSGMPDPKTFVFDPTPVEGGPAGTFSFTAEFCNIGHQHLGELKSVTTILTGGHVLLTRDLGTPPGVGSKATFPSDGRPAYRPRCPFRPSRRSP
jgi:hypothetical protein